MRSDEFLAKVTERTDLESQAGAMRAAQATLNTLAERLRGNEPLDLAAQLPEDLGQHLRTAQAGTGERFDADEFIQRVSEREGVDGEQGRRHAMAVLGVMSEAVSHGEMEDVMQQLPEDFKGLFQ